MSGLTVSSRLFFSAGRVFNPGYDGFFIVVCGFLNTSLLMVYFLEPTIRHGLLSYLQISFPDTRISPTDSADSHYRTPF